MNVAAYVLACEGRPDGLDQRVLGVVAAGSGVLVDPYGSKYGVGPYLKGVFATAQRAPEAPGGVLLVRDRDFDLIPTEAAALFARPAMDPARPDQILGYEVLLHRHEVESYLLDLEVMTAFFAANPPADPALRPTAERLREARHRAAQELAAYQAARWALGTAKPRRLSLATTWLSGKQRKGLPQDRDAAAMEAQLRAAVRRFLEQAAEINEQAVLERYHAQLVQFQQEAFWTSEAPLRWYVGSNLLEAIFDRIFPTEELASGWRGRYLDQAHLHLTSEDGRLLAADLQALQGCLQRWTHGEALAPLLQPHRGAG